MELIDVVMYLFMGTLILLGIGILLTGGAVIIHAATSTSYTIQGTCYDRLSNPINGITCNQTIYCDGYPKSMNNIQCENHKEVYQS